MSQELLSVDGNDNQGPFHSDPYQTAPLRASQVPEVRQQAMEIIGSVLGQGGQVDSDAADRLRAHVAAHPGKPERALLEHLMETGRINRGTGLLS